MGKKISSIFSSEWLTNAPIKVKQEDRRTPTYLGCQRAFESFDFQGGLQQIQHAKGKAP